MATKTVKYPIKLTSEEMQFVAQCCFEAYERRSSADVVNKTKIYAMYSSVIEALHEAEEAKNKKKNKV